VLALNGLQPLKKAMGPLVLSPLTGTTPSFMTRTG
jgi:hypothetical protein